MRNYVSLWDKNYLAKGLALYQSLQKHSSEPFTLYVLPLDPSTRMYLSYEIEKHVLPNMVLLSWDILPPDILSFESRGHNYFCWMLASEVTLAVFNKFRVPTTYLDSDIYFFDDPKKVFDVIGSAQIGIIPHRFPEHDFARLSPNGLYNVSFVYFDRTHDGRMILEWWNKKCREKCDAESCGDQKYLNEFSKMQPPGNVCSIEPIGMGAGPWNAYTYYIWEDNGKVMFNDDPLVFYHFHEFKRVNKDEYFLTGYSITEQQKRLAYEPYIKIIKYCQAHVDKKLEEWNA